jgi:hypothetical protein
MKFSVALIATFAALALAAPHQKRAAVLTTKTYDEFACLAPLKKTSTY